MPRLPIGKMKVRIKTSRKALQKRIARKAAPELARNIKRNEKLILNRAVSIFTEAFLNSRIIKALSGSNAGSETGADLQAEFGLTPELAIKAISDMIDVLSKTFTISASRGRARTSDSTILISFKLSGLDQSDYISKFKNLQSASYPSISTFGNVTKEREVNWMDWLLDADEQLAGVGISFDIRGALQRSASRSGRALMTSEKLADRFPWSVPSFVLPKRGNTFVEDVVLTRNFQSVFRREMERAFRAAVQ